jgi:hypothetical protein
LHLTWTVLPPRRIALRCLPRLQMHYRFEGVPDDTRQAFMRSFDRYMLRGGS